MYREPVRTATGKRACWQKPVVVEKYSHCRKHCLENRGNGKEIPHLSPALPALLSSAGTCCWQIQPESREQGSLDGANQGTEQDSKESRVDLRGQRWNKHINHHMGVLQCDGKNTVSKPWTPSLVSSVFLKREITSLSLTILTCKGKVCLNCL